jgi:membrane protein required for colicin V production
MRNTFFSTVSEERLTNVQSDLTIGASVYSGGKLALAALLIMCPGADPYLGHVELPESDWRGTVYSGAERDSGSRRRKEQEMALADLAIVVVIALTMLGGLTQGFFRSACSLGGLFLGLALAAWNYGLVAAMVFPLVHITSVANVIGFLLIALIVMGLAAVAGKILSKVFHYMGLSCLDRLAGAVFGIFQGALLVTLVILATVAFFPRARWLTEAELPRYFFRACHLSTRMGPAELAEQVRKGLKTLEDESPEWLHPGSGKL